MSLMINNVSVLADDQVVVKDIELSVEPGQAIAILGANGAGKSELVLGVAGVMNVCKGSIVVDSSDITNKAPDVIRRAGVAAVPEGHRVLTQLTVDDNLRAAGAVNKARLGVTLKDTYARFPELAERQAQLAGTLSGGQQQMLALGHALMSEPKYLLIDEMSLGLAPLIVKRLMGVVAELKANGVGIVLIEQFTELALGLADEAIVLRNGETRFAGNASILRGNPATLDAAYFGSES